MRFSSLRCEADDARRRTPASRLAPPTSAPSMSGCAISSATLSGLTEPPYWMRIASPAAPKRFAQPAADERVGLLRERGRRGPAGADRPDRLVGDHDAPRRARSATSARLPRELVARAPRRCGPPRAPRASRRRTRSGGCRAASSAAALLRDERVGLAEERGAARCGRRSRSGSRGRRASAATISPVKAPCVSGCTFCAASSTRAAARARAPTRGQRGEGRGDHDLDVAPRRATSGSEAPSRRRRPRRSSCASSSSPRGSGVLTRASPALRRPAARAPRRTRARRRRRSRGA